MWVHLALHGFYLCLFFQQLVDVILIDQSVYFFHHGIKILIQKADFILPVIPGRGSYLIFSFTELLHILDEPVEMSE